MQTGESRTIAQHKRILESFLVIVCKLLCEDNKEEKLKEAYEKYKTLVQLKTGSIPYFSLYENYEKIAQAVSDYVKRNSVLSEANSTEQQQANLVVKLEIIEEGSGIEYTK